MRLVMSSVILICVVFSGMLFAQEQVKEVLVQENTGTITAVIRNVDQNQKKLTVAVGFTLDNNTVITTQSGQTIKIGDLTPGSLVQITYAGTLENPVVKDITVIQKAQQ